MQETGSPSVGLRHVGVRRVVLAALMIAAGAPRAFAVPLPPPRPMLPPALVVPLPPERPEEDGPAMPPASGSLVEAVPPLPPEKPLEPAPAPPEPDLACAGLLSGGTVVAATVPTIAESGGCGIAAPVRVEAILLHDGGRVALSPAATMRCDLAASLADWIRNDVAAATSAEGDLLEVEDAAAYVCRSRNHLPGERLSEHARGNAIDILGLRFAHRTFGIAEEAAKPFWASLKASACLRFTTVLGPGSDPFHAGDLHLDLEHRRAGLHLCQWTAS